MYDWPGRRNSMLVSYIHLRKLKKKAPLKSRFAFTNTHVRELPFAHAISVINNLGRLELGRTIKIDEELLDHGSQILDQLVTMRSAARS